MAFYRKNADQIENLKKFSKTIMITTKCSGQCAHCLFSSNELEKRFLSIDQVEKIALSTKESLILISGGEPFEHPQLGEIVAKLSALKIDFRIATGGHIPMDQLGNLMKTHVGNFKGISMGTDVLFYENSFPSHSKIWKRNLEILKDNSIPYSLTITILNNSIKIEELFSILIEIEAQPHFFYIRGSEATIDEIVNGGYSNSMKNIAKNLEKTPTYFDILEEVSL